jgi:5-methylcytosine-specific restriction protein B
VGENQELTFTLYGKQCHLTREQVESSVAGWEPGPIDKYFVKIARRSFPIKQVFALALGIPPAEFTSQQAYGILRRLGFQIETR